MKNRQSSRFGFTLIELLVVVLIIGILAAVALPQYQKAVEKSRGVQALAIINSVAKAAEVYYMENGDYPASFDEIAVDMDGWTGTEKWSTITSSNYGILDTRSNGEWSLQMYKSSMGGLSLSVGRLKGTYEGGGFIKPIVNNPDASTDGLICAERKTSGKIFTAKEDSFCGGIWRAVSDGQTGLTYRSYIMP